MKTPEQWAMDALLLMQGGSGVGSRGGVGGMAMLDAVSHVVRQACDAAVAEERERLANRLDGFADTLRPGSDIERSWRTAANLVRSDEGGAR